MIKDPEIFDEDGDLVIESEAQAVDDRTKAAHLRFVRKSKINYLITIADDVIDSGFKSSATGVEYTYAGKQDDQINLLGVVATGLDLPFTVAAGGVRSNVNHTHNQLKQVVIDGAFFKQVTLTKLNSLIESVKLAATTEELDVIEW